MTNYEFCADWVLGQSPRPDVRVLDYGCGAGEIVAELRKRGIEAFGCDVFYDGGDYSSALGEGLRDVVRRMDGNVIPFEDASFDFVVSNQVMEHVADYDSVLSELERVLRPGGRMLTLFPEKGIWREGHCGVPFLHWFPKGGRFRIYYAAMFRTLGVGHYKGDKSVMQWSRDFCDWLDAWTHYRTGANIRAAYEKYFADLQHIEDYWLHQRLGDRKKLVCWLPRGLQRLIVRKLGAAVFVARKA